MRIFSMKTSLEILNLKISEHVQTRGYQTRLAKVARCQISYFSQILHRKALLNPDQGALLAKFWNFSDEECDYFLTLINIERASTPSLKTILLNRLKNIEKEALRKFHFHGEYLDKQELKDEDVIAFSSSWYYAAISASLVIPGRRTAEAIAQHFSLSLNRVDEVLRCLERLGMASYADGEWKSHGDTDIDFKHMVLHANFWKCIRQKVSYEYDNKGRLGGFTIVGPANRTKIEEFKKVCKKFAQECVDVSSEPVGEDVVAFCFDMTIL